MSTTTLLQTRGAARQRLRALAAALLLLAAYGGLSPLQAQRSGGRPLTTLSGRVVDQESGRPISGVLVEVLPANKRMLTDSLGEFQFRLREGDYIVEVSQLGYGEQRQVLSLAAEGNEPLRFALTGEPLVLEGLRVVADRFESRRHMVPMTSRVLDRRRLTRSGGEDLAQFVLSWGGVTSVPCSLAGYGMPAGFGGQGCVWRRGQVIEPSVFIDDRRATGGLMEVAMYSPRDAHHVEVYGRGAMIRVYTVGYVESVARGRRRLSPMYW